LRKTISFLAVLILCCSLPVLAQDGAGEEILSLTIPLAGGHNVSVSTTDVTWAIMYPPIIPDDWVNAEQILDWSFSWRMETGDTQKLICYSDGLTSSLGGAFVLDPSTHLKQIWTSGYGPLNVTLPGPAIGVEQEIALFPEQRGFRTATLELQFYNETGAFSAETFSGTIVYTMMAEGI